MSPRDVPGVPQRRRLHSQPELEPLPERVYELLSGFDTRISGLEQASLENEQQNSRILDKLEDIKATDRHALTKLIVGLATTAITVIAGQRLLAPSVAHVDPPASRSALDMRLDECRPIHESGSRAECFSRVFEETPK